MRRYLVVCHAQLTDKSLLSIFREIELMSCCWRWIRSMSIQVIICTFISVCVNSSRADTGTAANNTYPEYGVKILRKISPGGCWVFSHMNKSGGTTIRRMILPWLKAKGVTIALLDDIEWSSGQVFAQNIVRNNTGFTHGGYTEGLRLYDTRDCKWFTIFRQ